MRQSNVLKAVLLGLALSSAPALATDDPLVLVQRVTGVDEQGIEHVLLDDRAGIVTQLSAVSAVAARVNPRAAKAGNYRDIKIELAVGAFATDDQGLATRQQIVGEDRVLRLEGTLVVKKNGVDARDLATGSPENLRLNRHGHAARLG